MARYVVLVAALFGASGVAFGAYAAHGLEKRILTQNVSHEIAVQRLKNANTAVSYQLIHAVALLAVGAIALRRRSRSLSVTAGLWCLGVLLFSGSLALHALTGHMGHWAIIPAGGLLLIAGWLALAVHAVVRVPSDHATP